MEHFLDVYTKLIIAIISFIAPVIVYLLSMFSDGIAVITRRTNEEKNQISKLLRQGIVDGVDAVDTELIDKSNKALKQTDKRNNRRIRLLQPQRQIYRIFATLFLSLVLVMFDMLIKDEKLEIYNYYLSIILLLGSFIFFILGILILRQVSVAIIDTKKILAENKTAVKIGTTN